MCLRAWWRWLGMSLLTIICYPPRSDIYSIGLKTLISDTPEAMGPLIVSRATPFLLRGVSSDKADDGDIKVKIQCMDVLLELLNRFGAHMDEFKRQIMEVMLRQVSRPSRVV